MEELKAVFPDTENLAPIALRWILDSPEISCIIPGASKKEHLSSNITAIDIDSLNDEQRKAIDTIYKAHIKPFVHQLW